jgi:hypothetical protein
MKRVNEINHVHMKYHQDVQSARHQSHKVMTHVMLARLEGRQKYPDSGWCVHRVAGDRAVLSQTPHIWHKIYI